MVELYLWEVALRGNGSWVSQQALGEKGTLWTKEQENELISSCSDAFECNTKSNNWVFFSMSSNVDFQSMQRFPCCGIFFEVVPVLN